MTMMVVVRTVIAVMDGGDCIVHVDMSRGGGANRRTAVMVVNRDSRRVRVRGAVVGRWVGGR